MPWPLSNRGHTLHRMLKHSLAFLAVMATSQFTLAQPAPDCATGGVKAQEVAETKALLASVDESMDRQQAELGTILHAKWSEQDRIRFGTMLRSRPNTDYERQIASLTGELRSLQQAAQRGEIRGSAAECRHTARLREVVEQLKSVTERQTRHLTEQLRKPPSAPQQ